jgi:uncharacterized protein
MENYQERLTLKQCYAGAALAVLYYFGLPAYLIIRPAVHAVNRFYPMESIQQNRLAFLMLSALYVAAILYYSSFFKQALSSFGKQWKKNSLWIALGFVAIFVVSNMIIPTILANFGYTGGTANQNKLNTMIEDYPVIMAVNIVLIGPVIEELVYRVTAFRLVARRSRILAYLVSSLLFGFQHVYEAVVYHHHYAEIWNMTAYAVTGVILAYLYEKRRNIMVPLGTHVLNNLLGVIFMLL